MRLSVVVVYQSGAIEGRHRKEWKRLKPFAELAILIDASPADPTGRAKCFRAARRQRRPNPPFARPSNGPTKAFTAPRRISPIKPGGGKRGEGWWGGRRVERFDKYRTSSGVTAISRLFHGTRWPVKLIGRSTTLLGAYRFTSINYPAMG